MGDVPAIGVAAEIMKLSEVFGPTIQGEGPAAGRRCVFVRLARCNLDCDWCDTPYTWDWRGKNGVVYDPAAEIEDVDPAVVAESVVALIGEASLVVVSGGEPLLQAASLARLIEALPDEVEVHVETNGTRHPGPTAELVDLFVVSPKLASSGCGPSRHARPEAMRWFADNHAAFKFVVTRPDDLDEITAMVDHYGIDEANVWLMPQGRTADEVAAGAVTVHDALVATGRDWSISGRLHVTMWGDRRGV